MTFTLIGCGIAFDLTLHGMERLKSCDEAYTEGYTNPTDRSVISSLEESSGKKITELKREQVESMFLIENAKDKDIVLLVSGDPLTATTHCTLLMDARKKNIKTEVIHNSSIYSAAPARSGLQIYRFGKTASLVNPRENYKPTSSLEIIRKNLQNDMHSLVLLDTEPEPMDAKTALQMLKEFQSAVVISKAGWPDEKITYGAIRELSEKELGSAPFAIIIPAKLHVVENEFLESL